MASFRGQAVTPVELTGRQFKRMASILDTFAVEASTMTARAARMDGVAELVSLFYPSLTVDQALDAKPSELVPLLREGILANIPQPVEMPEATAAPASDAWLESCAALAGEIEDPKARRRIEILKRVAAKLGEGANA